jgi:hypothetical protein
MYVPLQILDSCLQGLMFSTPWLSPLQMPSPHVCVPSCMWTYLVPTIQKFLLHLCLDAALVTNKAAKHNDAGVPIHLWDQRYTQVFPMLH